MASRSRFFGLRGFKLNLAVAFVAGADFFLFGYDQGVMGGLLTLPSFYNVFPQIDTTSSHYKALSPSAQNHQSTVQGITIASYNLGCLIGAIVTIWIGNILGRRLTILLGSAIMVIGAAIQCSSFALPQLIVGRLVTGVGNGLNTSTVPTWQSECSKSHRRGQLVMIEGAMITGGICLSYWLDFGFSFLEPSSIAWRFPVAFQIVIALTIVCLVMRLPESPRWLILNGKEEEALTVLAALSDLPLDDPTIHAGFVAIKATVLEMAQGSFRDLFTMTETRHFHRTVLAYVNQVFQQISGINLITYYAATIYQNQIGLSHTLSTIIAAANGTEYFAASWIAVFTIERFGRRSLMIFGATGMSLSMVILAIATSFNNASGGICAATFLFVFNTFFAIGWLGMTWLYPAEIVPLRIRAPANALSTSANWAFNFMVVMITPVSFSSIKYKTYIVFAVINAVIVPVVYFFYPETAYRSLEEMDSIFRNTTGWFDVVKCAKEEPHWHDKNGAPIFNPEDTDGHRGGTIFPAKAGATGIENTDHTDPIGAEEKGVRTHERE
ncbi:hypothetical protein MMC26_007489 [Xylographa opegraphella]|nr:hypothetical protein [Xylographa opegraphella]